ncbi:MAG: hypothetical protein J6O04_01450 [Selenomonadaceae bacterium]|nr:hypothetical protein [Selenomonadaceae bacterium]
MGFCKEYGWTLAEVENSYLEDLLEMTIINGLIDASLNPKNKVKYIDDIL